MSVGVGVGQDVKEKKKKATVMSAKSSTSKGSIKPLPFLREFALSTKERRIRESKWLSKHGGAYEQETNTRKSFKVVLSWR